MNVPGECVTEQCVSALYLYFVSLGRFTARRNFVGNKKLNLDQLGRQPGASFAVPFIARFLSKSIRIAGASLPRNKFQFVVVFFSLRRLARRACLRVVVKERAESVCFLKDTVSTRTSNVQVNFWVDPDPATRRCVWSS